MMSKRIMYLISVCRCSYMNIVNSHIAVGIHIFWFNLSYIFGCSGLSSLKVTPPFSSFSSPSLPGDVDEINTICCVLTTEISSRLIHITRLARKTVIH